MFVSASNVNKFLDETLKKENRIFVHMHYLLFTFSFLFAFATFGQKEITLKKKYHGIYRGSIPEYKLSIERLQTQVNATTIRIEIEKDSISIQVGLNEVKGTYKVMFKAKKYYLIDATIDGQSATERIMVFKYGKKIKRDGLYPQPVTELKKI